ncbi:classical arabinogalactan protein 25 [Heracleum sosnowskyi]|uniref:Classical arabinogalactan protein 25 n=1 Tax=Heracleum sosnowskyi TaxID=360622 RepID=A0AAD8GN52_9APIA|nr:classical arabinogalactan protein 25 [Heracleum sosnowskyi]
MASFFGSFMIVTLNVMVLMASTTFSLSSHRLGLDTIAAAPAVLPTTPLTPSTVLPPDIAPLLPSGGVVPSSGSSIPTIPSNPSQNPDEIAVFGPESAIAPTAPLPESSAMSLNNVLVLSLLACWSVFIL